MSSGTPLMNMVGFKCHTLTVTEYHGKNRFGAILWLCHCACGQPVIHQAGNLRRNASKCPVCKLLPPGEKSFNELYGGYKHDALARNLAFEIDRDTFRSLIKSNCTYCGAVPAQIFKRDLALPYNGVDRVDNSLGYVTGNVTPCCGSCNSRKRTDSVEDFLAWVDRVYKHNHRNDAC